MVSIIQTKRYLSFLFVALSLFTAANAEAPLSSVADSLQLDMAGNAAFSLELGGRDIHEFSEEEMLKLIDATTSKYASHIPAPVLQALALKKNTLINLLRQYKVTGFSFCIDPNFALIFDNQNPVMSVYYKNDHGSFKERTYQTYIRSIGLKFQVAFNINLMFFVGTDLNFYDSNKQIELGMGLDLGLSLGCGINFTYASLAHNSGGLVIIGLPIGPWSVNTSIVTGGCMIPLN